MKKSIIVTVSVCFVIGVFIGIYYYNTVSSINNEDNQKQKIADAKRNSTIKIQVDTLENTIVTNSNEEKVGVATKILKKTYYKDCNHIIEQTDKATEDMINLTEEEFKKIFEDWEVQRFTSSEIVLYKEVEAFCNEHYILKNEDGYITIYKTDLLGNEVLYNTTDIWTEYLSEEDLKNIQKGLKVYTTKELNKLIEDFE